MNARIVLLHPYVPEGVQVILEANAIEVPMPLLAQTALSGAREFWAERLRGREGNIAPGGPKLVKDDKN